jgi:hypothetical protein
MGSFEDFAGRNFLWIARTCTTSTPSTCKSAAGLDIDIASMYLYFTFHHRRRCRVAERCITTRASRHQSSNNRIITGLNMNRITSQWTSAQPRSFRLPQFHWNFFRVHLLCHTAIPLVFSGIFHGFDQVRRNGHIDYIDSLFLCYSAMS